MTDILEQLYFSRIGFAEKGISEKTMKEKLNKLVQAEEEVMKALDDESRSVFERYIAVSSEVHADAVVNSYKDGFKTAVRLIFAGLAE